MTLDTILVIGSALPSALIGVLGFVVTTRPPTKKAKLFIEISFVILTVASLGFVISNGIQTNSNSTRSQKQSTDVQNQLRKIAESLGLSTDRSEKDITGSIIEKFNSLQSQINDVTSKVTVVQHPPPDQLKIYQGNLVVANVLKGNIAPDKRSVFFDTLSNTDSMNFDKTFMFRSMELSCEKVPLGSMMEATSYGMLMSARHNVSCSVVTN